MSKRTSNTTTLLASFRSLPKRKMMEEFHNPRTKKARMPESKSKLFIENLISPKKLMSPETDEGLWVLGNFFALALGPIFERSEYINVFIGAVGMGKTKFGVSLLNYLSGFARTNHKSISRQIGRANMDLKLISHQICDIIPIMLSFGGPTNIFESLELSVNEMLISRLVFKAASQDSFFKFFFDNARNFSCFSFEEICRLIRSKSKKKKIVIIIDQFHRAPEKHRNQILGDLHSFQRSDNNLVFILLAAPSTCLYSKEKFQVWKFPLLPRMAITKHFIPPKHFEALCQLFQNLFQSRSEEVIQQVRHYLESFAMGVPRALSIIRDVAMKIMENPKSFSAFIYDCAREYAKAIKNSENFPVFSEEALVVALFGRHIPLETTFVVDKGRKISFQELIAKSGLILLSFPDSESESTLTVPAYPPIQLLSLSPKLPLVLHSQYDLVELGLAEFGDSSQPLVDEESKTSALTDESNLLLEQQVNDLFSVVFGADLDREDNFDEKISNNQSNIGEVTNVKGSGNFVRNEEKSKNQLIEEAFSNCEETDETYQNEEENIEEQIELSSLSSHFEVESIGIASFVSVKVGNTALWYYFRKLKALDRQISPKKFEKTKFYCEALLRESRKEIKIFWPEAFANSKNYNNISLSELYDQRDLTCQWVDDSLDKRLKFDFTSTLREKFSKDGKGWKISQLPNLEDCERNPVSYENSVYFMENNNPGFESCYLLRSNCGQWIFLCDQEKLTEKETNQSGNEISESWKKTVKAMTQANKGWNKNNIVLLFKTNRDPICYRGTTTIMKKNVILLCRQSLEDYYGPTVRHLLYLYAPLKEA